MDDHGRDVVAGRHAGAPIGRGPTHVLGVQLAVGHGRPVDTLDGDPGRRRRGAPGDEVGQDLVLFEHGRVPRGVVRYAPATSITTRPRTEPARICSARAGTRANGSVVVTRSSR